MFCSEGPARRRVVMALSRRGSVRFGSLVSLTFPQRAVSLFTWASSCSGVDHTIFVPEVFDFQRSFWPLAPRIQPPCHCGPAPIRAFGSVSVRYTPAAPASRGEAEDAAVVDDLSRTGPVLLSMRHSVRRLTSAQPLLFCCLVAARKLFAGSGRKGVRLSVHDPMCSASAPGAAERPFAHPGAAARLIDNHVSTNCGRSPELERHFSDPKKCPRVRVRRRNTTSTGPRHCEPKTLL